MSDDTALIVPNGTKAVEPQKPAEQTVQKMDVSMAAAKLPRISFSQTEYRGATSALITVVLSKPPQNECRVTFTARDLFADRERVLATQELVFQNNQDSNTFLLPVGPNFSLAEKRVRLELSQPANAELADPSAADVIVAPTESLRDYPLNLIRSIVSDPSTGRVSRHILLGLALLLAIAGLDSGVGKYADYHQKQWDIYLNPQQRLALVFATPSPAPADATTNAPPVFADYEQTRLRDQLSRIRRKQDFHLSLMEFFYKGYYMGIIILSFTGALAAISLVLISKKGWAATSEYVITTFFIMTCAALFYGSWAGLFKQEENITNNKILYLRYTTLENELFSYVATGEALQYDITSEDIKQQANASAPQRSASPAPAGNAKAGANQASTKQPETKIDPDKSIGIRIPPSVFIHYVDLQLAQDNIAIGFDYSQIPNYKSAFSNIGNGK